VNLKKVAAEMLGKNSIRNISKVVAIAQCEAIQNNKDKLPKSWTTLSVLASAKNAENLIKEGKVTSDSSRAEISRLIKTGQSTKPLKWVYVELAGDTKTFSKKQLDALKKLLNGSEWSVKEKKEEPAKK
jgi:hypothetical protein